MEVPSDPEEPCTQPLTDEDQENTGSQDSLMDIDQSQAYGYLIPLRIRNAKNVYLNEDQFTVGRSVNASFQIEDNKSFKNFSVISKIHFKIVRDPLKKNVIIQDVSSNGTYLNGKIIGKNKFMALCHADNIGLAMPRAKHYLFMSSSNENLDKYPPELRNHYTMSQELGKGACGTVVFGIRKTDNKQVAIKIINKKKVTMVQSAHNVMNEVKLLRKIQHPCIIKLEDVIETETELFIILELADGGELFDKIVQKSKLGEDEAKLHFYQIVSAIEYLHSQNIAHRDLKPENILLCSEDDQNPVVKVTDLGLSKFVDVDTHLKTFCGTPQYLAPEVLFSRVRGDGSYNLKVDIWSLGVILYILLCGRPPFDADRTDKPLIRQITEGEYSFPNPYWNNISPEAIDLVKRMMTVEPRRRLSAKEVMQHPWMKDKVIVARAEKLMEEARSCHAAAMESEEMTPLNGILPKEWEHSTSNGNKSGNFKRPFEEEEGSSSKQPSCKRRFKD